MCNATINLISPGGVPVALAVSADDDHEEIIATLKRADRLGQWAAEKGWSFAEASAAGPPAAELDAGPRFASYPCSPTMDDAGRPTWIIVGDRQAHRREKQGDVWYSLKEADGTYTQIMRIPKGEIAPPVTGIE